jgi:phosphoribosylamine-glycine ligase
MPKQSFYIYSEAGDGCVLAWRLMQEGYEVKLNIKEHWMRPNLDGLVKKTTAKPSMDDIIIFDSVGSGSKASRLRKDGYCVIGACEFADKIELDRSYADELWQMLEIQTPRTESFDSISAGVEFVSSNHGRWVFKPSDNLDCAFTYCARDEMDLVSMLLHFSSVLGDSVSYVLQEFVEGIVVSTEGWFDGEAWVEGAWNGTIESKGLCVGDIGPKTGCSWCVVWSYDDMPRIAKATHEKLTQFLFDDYYIGPWDMNCVIDPKGEIYLLEATPRFGYDAIEAYSALMQLTLGEMLIKLANQDTQLWPIAEDGIAASLRVVIEPYPFASAEHVANDSLPVRYRHEDENYLWLTGVRKYKNKLLSSPTDGTIGIITACGNSKALYSVCEDLKQRARRLMVPNLFWRDDCGAGVESNLYQLASLGFESPLASEINSPMASITPTGISLS